MTSPAPRPTLFLLAGPNGAGKSTFYETVLKPRVQAPSINADIIQLDELKDPAPEAAHEAARITTERRNGCQIQQRSFVTETVFSHPSKLEMLTKARRAGFRLVVFHLHLGSADLAVERVRARAEEGGLNQSLIHDALLMADHGAVYDSSPLNEAPTLLARTRLGKAEFIVKEAPEWFQIRYGRVL